MGLVCSASIDPAAGDAPLLVRDRQTVRVIRRGAVTPYRRRELTPEECEIFQFDQQAAARCRGATLEADQVSNRTR
jgi:hypothetical protein